MHGQVVAITPEGIDVITSAQMVVRLENNLPKGIVPNVKTG